MDLDDYSRSQQLAVHSPPSIKASSNLKVHHAPLHGDPVAEVCAREFFLSTFV